MKHSVLKTDLSPYQQCKRFQQHLSPKIQRYTSFETNTIHSKLPTNLNNTRTLSKTEVERKEKSVSNKHILFCCVLNKRGCL